jgi:hypothetical protein
MTVAELIIELQKMPQDHAVKAWEQELEDHDDIVELDKDSYSVYLTTAHGKAMANDQ